MLQPGIGIQCRCWHRSPDQSWDRFPQLSAVCALPSTQCPWLWVGSTASALQLLPAPFPSQHPQLHSVQNPWALRLESTGSVLRQRCSRDGHLRNAVRVGTPQECTTVPVQSLGRAEHAVTGCCHCHCVTTWVSPPLFVLRVCCYSLLLTPPW